MAFFSGNALWHLIAQSDTVSKLVLLLLLVLSIMCWALFTFKLFLFRIRAKQARHALHTLRAIQSEQQLQAAVDILRNTAPGHFISSSLSYNKVVGNHSGQALNMFLEGEIDTIVAQEEAYLPFLSTTAAVSPLLGLFGTVWGLIHAFVRISERQSADITTVAPGLAEALITTLAGLMVAIPALVMYNVLSAQVRRMEQFFVRISDRIIAITQQIVR